MSKVQTVFALGNMEPAEPGWSHTVVVTECSEKPRRSLACLLVSNWPGLNAPAMVAVYRSGIICSCEHTSDVSECGHKRQARATGLVRTIREIAASRKEAAHA